MKNIKLLIILLLISLLMVACGKKEIESKNIEQIYKEEGIPASVKLMKKEEFSLKLPFTGRITGLRQSFATAKLGGRIEKILVNVGDYVEADQVIVEFPEDSPNGQFHQAKAAFKLAESTYNKMKDLYNSGGISKLDLEKSETQYLVNKANYDAVSQMLKVRAPISGYVTSIAVNETDGVHAEDILATISQSKTLKSKIWITEEEISSIKKNQTAIVEWNGISLKGKVTRVGMTMDITKNAFGVDLQFDNSKGQIQAGIIGDIEILSYRNPSTLVVSRKNVSKDSKGKYVFILKDGKAKKVHIETGKENGKFEIKSGLKEGDKVITSSLNLITSGDKIKIIK